MRPSILTSRYIETYDIRIECRSYCLQVKHVSHVFLAQEGIYIFNCSVLSITGRSLELRINLPIAFFSSFLLKTCLGIGSWILQVAPSDRDHCLAQSSQLIQQISNYEHPTLKRRYVLYCRAHEDTGRQTDGLEKQVSATAATILCSLTSTGYSMA